MCKLIEEIQRLHDRRADACARARRSHAEFERHANSALRDKIEMNRIARKIAVERGELVCCIGNPFTVTLEGFQDVVG